MLLKYFQNISIEQPITNELYQTVLSTLAQPLCDYRCVICTRAAPMCCYGVCVQGVHSTGHLQHPTQELAIRGKTLT